MPLYRRRTSAERMKARRYERRYKRRTAMRANGRLTTKPISVATKRARKTLSVRGFYKSINKLRETVQFPPFKPGVVEADARVIDAILEAAAASSDPAAFAKVYLEAPPEYLGTGTGVAALAFEAMMAENGSLADKFVETVVEPGKETFTAIFHGKLTEQDWEYLDNVDWLALRALIEAGDHSYSEGTTSDMTIFECSADPAAFADDDDYEAFDAGDVAEEGGLAQEVFEFITGAGQPEADGAIVEHGAQSWLRKGGRWLVQETKSADEALAVLAEDFSPPHHATFLIKQHGHARAAAIAHSHAKRTDLPKAASEHWHRIHRIIQRKKLTPPGHHAYEAEVVDLGIDEEAPSDPRLKSLHAALTAARARYLAALDGPSKESARKNLEAAKERMAKARETLESEQLDEKSPPGWAATVEKMKTAHPHKFGKGPGKINPWALANSMHKKGYRPHYKKGKAGNPVKIGEAHPMTADDARLAAMFVDTDHALEESTRDSSISGKWYVEADRASAVIAFPDVTFVLEGPHEEPLSQLMAEVEATTPDPDDADATFALRLREYAEANGKPEVSEATTSTNVGGFSADTLGKVGKLRALLRKTEKNPAADPLKQAESATA